MWNFLVELFNKHKEKIFELLKFVLVGGANTLLGGILLPYIFQLILTTYELNIFGFILDIPLVLGFLVWFPFAYFLQIKFVFNCKFEWGRFLLYPLTQIPNLLINQGLLFLFKDVLQLTMWDNLIARVLAAGCALPIMFILVRLVVKPLTNKEDNVQESEEVNNG